jgi:hypothetical protein
VQQKNQTMHYCHISFRTEEVLAVFPGDRERVDGIERIGDTFILNDKPNIVRQTPNRGRPPYRWDAFHIEVAELVRRNELPAKKEAAIEHFRSWFQQEYQLKISRS